MGPTHGHASVLAILFFIVAYVPGAQAQRQRHPLHDFLVEGSVLRADGRPAVGVEVERRAVRRFSAESRTTDVRGRFRFEHRGFGWGPGPTWTLTIRRPGCPDVIRSISLRRTGGARAEARNVELRLPLCEADSAAR